MNAVTIYRYKDLDGYGLGQPFAYLLSEPSGSHAWYTSAEYALPEGYEVAESCAVVPQIYNRAGKACPLFEFEGGPAILDEDRFVPLREI